MSALHTRLAVLASTGALAATGLTVGAATAQAHSIPACGNHALAVTRTYVDSGAGHSWMSLVYRNITRHSCSITGYPGLDAVRNGHVLAHAARRRDGHPVRSVTVAPGGYASAGVEWENFNGATGKNCRFSTAVRTTVANTGRVHRLRVSVSRCGLEVHPTLPGTPMYPHYGPAQHYWIAGSKATAARTNFYLDHAANQLARSRDFRPQVRQLRKLAALPETGLTRKQRKQARMLVRELDAFFATPGLYR